MWSVGATTSVAIYGSHERSNVLQLKKSLANRKLLQKHTKHKRSWIKINGNRKKPSQPWWSCFKPAPLQSFTFFWFLSLPQLVHQVIGTPETFLLCFVRFCCCFFSTSLAFYSTSVVMLAFAVFFSLLFFFKVAFRLTSQGHCSTAASQSRTVHTATSG